METSSELLPKTLIFPDWGDREVKAWFFEVKLKTLWVFLVFFVAGGLFGWLVG